MMRPRPTFPVLALIALLPALILLVSPAGAASTASADKVSRIGVLAFRGRDNALRRWMPTAAYLSRSIANVVFRIVPLSLDEMKDAVERMKVDFVLTNTGDYVDLEARLGISRIVTLRAPPDVEVGNVFGAVIFTRAGRDDIKTLKDLKGKSLMAVMPNGFGGFQMGWFEMKKNGIDPFTDLSSLTFSGFPQDQVAYAVRDGKVDAGTFRSDALEKMASEGKIRMSEFKILAAKKYPGFPFAVSTKLYPEWPFAKVKHTSDSLAQKVAVALLDMAPDSPAAKAGDYGGWTVPLDYQPVHELFRKLRIGPYKNLGKITLSDIAKQYGRWVPLVVAGILLIAGWGLWTEYLVSRRTFELSAANKELEKQIVERRRAEDIARQRQAELAHAARLNTMGEMASGFAHELNQPLSAITNYAQGCVRRLDRGLGGDNASALRDAVEVEALRDAMEQVSAQAGRAAKIIRRIRSFVRKEQPKHSRVDVNALIRDVADFTQAEFDRSEVLIGLDLGRSLPPVQADAIQIEQVILNLIRNGIEAMNDVRGRRRLDIATRPAPGGIRVSVRDRGQGIPVDNLDHIFDPFVTTKPGGLGLGLSISQSIIEAHGGRLFAESPAGGGTRFRFTLPAAEVEND
jgi:two-component system sensor histidine kinase TtrS